MSVKMAGQTINDRLLAARHSLAGQGLAKSVCKATTEEMIGPKKKHLDYLIHCTNEPNVSIPQMANLLIERSQNANWVVVFKALITVHHMMCYGNERFTQYLASSNSTFQLSNFLDKSGVQGARIGYDMSPFIRRYAKYLNEKALSYRTVAFDFCKVKRGKEDGTLRLMNAEKLLKTLPVLQSQLDALLEFDCTANDLTNGVINMAFMLLFRDLIRLFACYNDGIINLLEKYFDMNKKQCRDALDLYKKFLIRMDRVAEFLKVAENVGIDKGDIPDLTKAPSSLLDALEQHLASLEGKKGSAANTPTQSASNRTNVKSGVSALSSTSTAFGTAAANNRLDSQTNGIDESLKQQVLAEEEAAMNQYKAKVSSPTGMAPSTNPFLSSPTNSGDPSQPIVDLFGSPPTADGTQSMKASDDLLQLSANPFADMFSATPQSVPVQPQATDMWLSNGYRTTQPNSNAFVSDQSFNSVFGSSDPNSTAPTGMTAPNPFMSDFCPASGGQVQPPSSAGMGGMFEDQGSVEESKEPDLFGNQSTDLFGDVTNDALLQSSEQKPSGISDFHEESSVNAPSLSDEKLPSDAVLGGISEPFVTMQQFSSSFSPSPAPSPGKVASPPPPRPPPPVAAATGVGTPRTMSPVPGIGGSPSRSAAVSKSAFDDLNDSIRAALGGSPTRPPAPQTTQPTVPPNFAVGGFGNFDTAASAVPSQIPNLLGGGGGGMVFGQAPTSAPIVYGSPAKQGVGMTGFDALGDVLQPASFTTADPISAGPQTDSNTGKVLTGDLDSCLASLAENLSINKGGQAAVKGVQWNSPKNAAKPGVTGWSPQPMAATTGAGYRPMGMQPMPSMRPMMGAPVVMPPAAPMMGVPRVPLQQGPAQFGGIPQQNVQSQPPLDPFGAL